jgi:hypothetical protein
VALIDSLPTLDPDDSLRDQSRQDLNTIATTLKNAVNDLEARKIEVGDIPTLVRSSWDALNIDRDFSSSYDASVGWSGAFDTAMVDLGEGGVLTLGRKNYPTIRPVRYRREAQRILGPGSEYFSYPSNFAGASLQQVIQGCCLIAMDGFTGEALVLAQDATLNDGVEPANCSIVGVGLDGKSKRPGGTGLVHGILVKGLVRGFQALEVNIIQTSGRGVWTAPYGSTGPRGGRFRDIQVWSAGTSATQDQEGFHFDGLTDAKINGLLAVSNEGHGIRFTSPGQIEAHDLHSVFNKGGSGIVVDGGSGNGGITLTGIHTDRNAQDGITVSAYGSGQHVSIANAELRRDGSNGDDGQGGGGFAGLALRGAEGLRVCRVQALNLNVNVEDNDSNNGVYTPSDVGVYADWIEPGSTIHGQIWGLTKSLEVTANSTGNLGIMDEGTRFWTGPPSARVRSYPDIRRGKENALTLPMGSGQFVIPSGTPGDPSVGNISPAYRYGGSAAFYEAQDLRRSNYLKLVAGVTSPGPTGSYLRPQYTTDLTGASGWTYFAESAARLDVDGAAGLKQNFGWVSVPPAAKTDVLIRIVGHAGDGSTPVTFAHLTLHTRI